MRNNFFKVLGLVGLALFLACAAHADGTPVNMVFTGVNGAQDGQYYVSPYIGTMNGQTVTLFCDDMLHEVTFGQTWSANVTNLGFGHLYKQTLTAWFWQRDLGRNDRSSIRRGGLARDPVRPRRRSQWVSIQHALWDLTDPGAGYTDVGTGLSDAKLA